MMTSTARRTFRSMLIAAAALGLAGRAWGEWEQTHLLTADDAAAGDLYGNSVSISGGIAIVGAPGDDVAGDDAGSASLIDVASGQQLHQLMAGDAGAYDAFGASVAISGGFAIVGAPRDDDTAIDSGAAYVFDVASGQQLHKLVPDDPAAFDRFGNAVSMIGNVAIVGARLDDDAGSSSGSAYLFDVVTGQQLHKLTAGDAAAYDEFGASVAISGGVAIVGAPLDADAGTGSGSAYLFDMASGEQLHKLTASDAEPLDGFGTSVSISGNTAIIGNRQLGIFNHGSAYLFDVMTGQQLHELTADDSQAGDEFGYCVSISGGVAIVGAREHSHGVTECGAAYLFDVASGQLVQELIAADAASYDEFGCSVAISGGVAVVGAYNKDDAGSDSGSAYVFKACPADLDNDGMVTVTDLITVILNWGCTGACGGDANYNGSVDVMDVIEVILNWGQCAELP